MRYIIVTIEWCMEHGIVPPIHARRSVDGTMILLHEDFVAPVLGDEEISSYRYDSNELSEILNSEVWTEMNGTEGSQGISYGLYECYFSRQVGRSKEPELQ